ncbi:hypothetical protein FRB93_009848 [Tulasnella sp. JGI-2019a]|nr:hypothetical protein FRB93_009848 [Tulasnella sp. JGI-2019a]
MIATLLEDAMNNILRMINRDYRTRSFRLIAECHSVAEYMRNGGNTDINASKNMDRAREAAEAALTAALADPPRHQEIIDAFTHAEGCLRDCTLPKHPLYRKLTATDLKKAKKRYQSHIAQTPTRPWDLAAPSTLLPTTLNNPLSPESSRMAPVTRGQPSRSTTPSVAIDVPIALASPPSVGSGSNDPMPITNVIPTENLVATSSVVPPSVASGDTIGLSITVAVFEEFDMERPQASRTYKFLEADADRPLSVLIFKVTDPEHPENQLTPMRAHTQWYVRETGRHSHTKNGLAFCHLDPERCLRDIPACNDMYTVCIVQSDKPYIVLVTGKGRKGPAADTTAADKGAVIKDYFDLELTEACTYYNLVHYKGYSITAEKKQKWKDLPRHQVEHYSADWVKLLPSDASAA